MARPTSQNLPPYPQVAQLSARVAEGLGQEQRLSSSLLEARITAAAAAAKLRQLLPAEQGQEGQEGQEAQREVQGASGLQSDSGAAVRAVIQELVEGGASSWSRQRSTMLSQAMLSTVTTAADGAAAWHDQSACTHAVQTMVRVGG